MLHFQVTFRTYGHCLVLELPPRTRKLTAPGTAGNRREKGLDRACRKLVQLQLRLLFWSFAIPAPYGGPRSSRWTQRCSSAPRCLMRQPYFVVVVAHSLHGRLRRIHIPQQLLYVVVLFALLGCVSVFGFVSSYARMAWKVANYNSLRKDAESLRARYDDLQEMYNRPGRKGRICSCLPVRCPTLTD